MNTGICYLLQGTKHWPVMLVSVASVIERTHLPICILTVGEDAKHFANIIQRQWPEIEQRDLEGAMSGKNSGYANKTLLIEQSPWDETIFLDADTQVMDGRLEDMLPFEEGVVTFTQFSDWATSGPTMSGRINEWSDTDVQLVQNAIANPAAAINTGVFAFDRGCLEYGRAWNTLTRRRISFICDEIAAQLLLPDMLKAGTARVVGDSYNWSPIYSTSEDPVVIHYHGRKHLRERAATSWLPAFTKLWEQNVANVRDWAPAGDKRLRAFMIDNNWK